MSQQIQFISLSQNEYDALGSNIVQSRLYFTSDTHRIYKGSDLYASTQFDTLSFTEIEAKGITVDGESVATVSQLPTKTSDLTNDSGYITSSDVDLSGYMPITGATLNSNFILKSATLPGNYIEWDNQWGYFDVYGEDGGFVFHDGTWNAFDAGSWIEFDNWGQVKTNSQTLEEFIKSLISSTAPKTHSHSISDITNLQTTLNGKSDDGHTHSVEDITDWSTTDIQFNSIDATSLTVNGKEVSVEGHKHNEYSLTTHTHPQYVTMQQVKDEMKDEVEFGSIEADELWLGGRKITAADIGKGGAEFQLKIPSQSVDKTIDKLVVNKLTSSEYEALKNSGTLNNEELYFVDSGSTKVDGGNQTISNVSTPVSASDAATKGYVDTQVGQARQDVIGIETRIEGNVKTYVDGLLDGFDPGNNAETEAKLTGITETGITKSTGTITTLNSTTINAKDINLTGTLGIDEATVTDLNVSNLNVSGGLMINGQSAATKDYVTQAIEAAIGQVLNTEF